ncbi:MAG: hypothetical protein IJ965_08510, partial [Campylobacter sp.]|nr:hypothetical protein [Campylobacter sp.]
MTKIKLSALACAILVGGGQQLVAEDSNNIIDLGNYSYQTVDINNEKKIITGNSEGAVINVKNNGELRSEVSDFFYTDINIKKNSNATFENEVWLDNPKLHIKNNSNAIFENEVSIEYPNFHIINNSTAVFNKALYMWNADDDRWPVIEQDNDFSGGNLSLDNSTLDIKGTAEFDETSVLINHGSTATIDYLDDYGSKIYVVNDSELEINKDAIFRGTHLIIKDNSNTTIKGELTAEYSAIYEDNKIYVVNDSKLEIDKNAIFDEGTHLIIENNSNTTINGALTIKDYDDSEFAKGGIKIAKSNLNVAGEVNFYHSDTELNNSSNVNFKDKLTLLDSAMLLKNSSSLNVGGVADFTGSALVVQNGSKVMFNDNFTMKNGAKEEYVYSGSKVLFGNNFTMKKRAEKSMIILDNGSEINVKGDFENHGVIYYGASADSAPKITVEGKATLKDTTEIGIYATSGLNQAVFLESKEEIENQATDDNIYAMYFDPNNEDANEEGLVKYDQNIIDAVLNLSEDGKKLLVQILMSDDMKNKLINEKIDFIAKSTQAAGVNLTAQDLDIITSLFTIGDAKGNGAVATEAIKLAEQAKQGNQEAAQIISKTAQSIQKNSQDSINATSNLINTFNLAT